jgi:hypothetical protein
MFASSLPRTRMCLDMTASLILPFVYRGGKKFSPKKFPSRDALHANG